MKNLSVLEAKRFGVFSCHAHETMGVAACQMADRDISCLVVVDEEGYLEGLISRTDLMRACVADDDWRKAQVSDYMSRAVVTVSTEDSLDTVMRLLVEKHIHRVVAIQPEDGKLWPMAVLSAADIVYHMMREGKGC